jgi:hypothetical protein
VGAVRLQSQVLLRRLSVRFDPCGPFLRFYRFLSRDLFPCAKLILLSFQRVKVHGASFFILLVEIDFV